MKKIIVSIIALVSLYTLQAQAIETKATYNKVAQPAVLAEYIYDAAIVETAITDDLKQRGFGKGKSTKGYNLYQAINFAEISADKIDLYIKTEKKSKKEKDRTIVTVLVSKGYDNFVSGTTETAMMTAILNYVNGLKPKFDTNSLELQVKDQEELVKKAEKKYNNLTDEGVDLEKKKRKVEDDIATNKNDQSAQKNEVEKQRQILASLKAQRKG